MTPIPLHSSTSSRGFTLVELMVVVSIVGILAGLSIVSFGRNWRDERVKAATRETTAWLDEVRRIAIQNSTPCQVIIDRADAKLSLDNAAGYCASSLYRTLKLRNTVQNANELILCSTNLTDADPASYALSCSSPQSGSSTLIFTPRGTSTTGLLIKLHMPQTGTDRCIAVMSPLGQIRSGKATSSGCDFTTAY